MKSVNNVLEIISNHVCLMTGRDIRDRSRRYQIPIARHYFVLLSDHYLNTKELKSEYSKTLFAVTGSKKSYHSVIAQYIGFTKMFVFQSKSVARNMYYSDRNFASNVNKLIKEIDKTLNNDDVTESH